MDLVQLQFLIFDIEGMVEEIHHIRTNHTLDDLEPSKFERGKHPICTGTVEFFLSFMDRRPGNDLNLGIHLPGTEEEKHIFRIDPKDGD